MESELSPALRIPRGSLGMVESMAWGGGEQAAWVQIPALPLRSRVTSDKLPGLSEPGFLIGKVGRRIIIVPVSQDCNKD